DLGLHSGASLAEVKASYRKLARQFHPDVNPGDRQAQEKFIAVTEAYKLLVAVAPRETQPPPKPTAQPKQTRVKVVRKQTPTEDNASSSELELLLKRNSYLQLQQLLKERRFPRAIALVEGLANRLPQDREVRQWQAIAYQRWGRQLIAEGNLDKARIYLKKALKTDPHNRALWTEVERDFRRLERVY
ncbi:MAG: DnaJ domain-containing protein, partial [Okeania sp. SIO2H7]|nr:DnaJ domain-containing protein [Okeania sp. SIO2H7]